MSLAPLCLLTIGLLGETEPVGEDLPRIPASEIELIRDANGNPVSIRVSGGVRPPDDPNRPNEFIEKLKRKFADRINKSRRRTMQLP